MDKGCEQWMSKALAQYEEGTSISKLIKIHEGRMILDKTISN